MQFIKDNNGKANCLHTIIEFKIFGVVATATLLIPSYESNNIYLIFQK